MTQTTFARACGHRVLLGLTAATIALATAIPGAAALERGAGDYLAARHAGSINDSKSAAKFYARALANAPDDEMLLEQTMLHQVAAGSPAAAVPAARKLAEADPDDKLALLTLVVDDLAREEYDAALARLTNATESARKTIVAPLLTAWARVGAGEAATGAEAFEDLGEEAVFRVFDAYHRGLAEALLDRPDAAVEAFEEAYTATSSPSARLAEAYGRALMQFERWEDAERVFAAALETDPDDSVLAEGRMAAAAETAIPAVAASAREGAAEALYGLAGAYSRSDDGVRLAMIYLQLALRLAPEHAAGRVLLGDIHGFQRQWEEAEAAFAATPPGSPYSRLAQIGRADALAELERVDEAVAILAGLSAEYPDDAALQVERGDILRRFERYEEAVGAYDDAFAIIGDPEERHWRLLFSRGVALERTGRWDDAEIDLQAALAFRPENARVLNYLGYSWIEQGRNLNEAREMIERAVDNRPDDGYIIDSLGWVLYRLDDYAGAVTHLERAVELRPTDAVINDHFGDALWKVGRKLEARFQWKRALSFDPEEEGVKERIERKLAEGLDAVLADEAQKLAEDATRADGD